MDTPERKNLLLDQIRRMATLQQLRHLPDRELLAQFSVQGNETAFRVLMDRYGTMVLRVCKRILGNDQDAEDAYQATFFVLASKAGSERWQDSVATWLHRLAVCTARNARRAEQRRRLRAVFRALPERDRQCLSLRAQGLRYREIAKALGISLGAVAKSLAHAVMRLSHVKG